jgi:hypothetical protein
VAWHGMPVDATAYLLLQGPQITENKSQHIERTERIGPSIARTVCPLRLTGPARMSTNDS